MNRPICFASYGIMRGLKQASGKQNGEKHLVWHLMVRVGIQLFKKGKQNWLRYNRRTLTTEALTLALKTNCSPYQVVTGTMYNSVPVA